MAYPGDYIVAEPSIDNDQWLRVLVGYGLELTIDRRTNPPDYLLGITLNGCRSEWHWYYEAPAFQGHHAAERANHILSARDGLTRNHHLRATRT